jgi:dienelactone hydrolase
VARVAACAGVAVLLVLQAGCQPPLPDELDRRFAEWFVDASPEAHAALVEADLSPRQLDSIARHSRPARAATGALVRTLRDTNDIEYTVGIHTPERLDATRAYPLIVYLHGGIGTRRATKGERAYTMLLPLADSLPLLLASPSANRFAPWWSAAGVYRILQTVRYMTLHYPVDPARIVLAGVSDGATGVYAVANAACGPFAGFIAVSGFGGMLPRLGMELVPDNLMQRPIYNVNAGEDHLYPIDRVEAFVAGLRAAGVDIISNIYPDEKHGFAYREREWATLTGMLKRWRRPNRTAFAWRFVPHVPNHPPALAAWSIAARPASIRGHWRDDMLHLKSTGLHSAAVVITDAGEDAYRVSVRESQRRMSVSTASPLYLALMRTRSTPRIGHDRIVAVEM